MNNLKQKTTMFTDLLRAVPVWATLLYLLSVVLMNFLARITMISFPWVALDAGTTVSWMSFLFVDIVTRHFGAKAANLLSLLAIAVNLTVSLVCVILSRIFDNPSLDMVVGGQWSILLASTLAFLVAALVNNYLNVFIGKTLFRGKDQLSVGAFVTRSYVSTSLSQFVDNFLFVWLAFVVFPHIPGALQVQWTVAQCVGSAVLTMLFELVSEVVFSPIGYRVAKKWKEKNVGEQYLATYCPNGVL